MVIRPLRDTGRIALVNLIEVKAGGPNRGTYWTG